MGRQGKAHASAGIGSSPHGHSSGWPLVHFAPNTHVLANKMLAHLLFNTLLEFCSPSWAASCGPCRRQPSHKEWNEHKYHEMHTAQQEAMRTMLSTTGNRSSSKPGGQTAGCTRQVSLAAPCPAPVRGALWSRVKTNSRRSTRPAVQGEGAPGSGQDRSMNHQKATSSRMEAQRHTCRARWLPLCRAAEPPAGTATGRSWQKG